MHLLSTIRRRAAATAALSGLAASLLLAMPAHADGWSTTDPEDRRLYAGDVSSVDVQHRERRVVFRVDFHDRIYDAVDVWVDTPARRSRPELVVQYDQSYYSWHGVRRASRDFEARRLLDCDAMRVRVDDAGDTLRMAVPRRCLSTDGVVPGRVRVSVDSRDETFTAHDWAPGREEFGRWISAG